MLYLKPEIRFYSCEEIEQKIGFLQSQYNTPDPEPTTTTLDANANDWIFHYVNQQLDVFGLGSIEQPGNPLLVGDTTDYVDFRSIVSFDISSVSGTVTSATLRLYQRGIEGTPYVDLGALSVDHVNVGNIEAGADDYSGNTLTGNFSSNTSDAVGWLEFAVPDEVTADIAAGRTTSQFRLSFGTTTDNDAEDDIINIENLNNDGGTGNTPQLVITYQ